LPNILFFLADDPGYGDAACYNFESKVPTPDLDKLAGEGMRFTNAHSPSTVCTPSRYMKLTSGRMGTGWHNATKFDIIQILMAITLASISGISRISWIVAFSGDGLVKALLRLDKAINENAISSTLKSPWQSGAPKLQKLLLSRNARWVPECLYAGLIPD
jgi:hypothetical protein